MIGPLLMSAASVAASSVSVERAQTSPGIVRTAVAAVLTAVSPTRRNVGNLPQVAQIEAVERKAGRPASMRSGLNIVERVRTSPYIGSDGTRMDLRAFAELCGEVTGTGRRGGYVLAVLCSVETWAGFTDSIRGSYPGRNPSCYNGNPGNFKYPRAALRTEAQTPPLWFLVDNIASLDLYPSFMTGTEANWRAGIQKWGEYTFANSRYNQYGTMDALRAGNLRLFCRAIGLGGYAASYAQNPRTLHARARMLMREAPYNNRSGPASLDRGVMILD